MIDKTLPFPTPDKIESELRTGIQEGLHFRHLRHERKGPQHFLHILFDEAVTEQEAEFFKVKEMQLAVPQVTAQKIETFSERPVDLVVRRDRTIEGMKVLATVVTAKSHEDASFSIEVSEVDDAEYQQLAGSAEQVEGMIRPFKYGGKKYKAVVVKDRED